MNLSACMIVKNEEDVIERCIHSIAEHVDEIVILDTGSTDSTLDLVEGLQAEYDNIKLHHAVWNDNFSDMRNKSLSLATSDRVLIIDADEYVDESQDWDLLRKVISEEDFISGKVQILNKTRTGPVIGEYITQPRLLRRHPDIKYEYSVHNQIDHSIAHVAKIHHEETGRRALDVAIPFSIIHTGYDLSPEQLAKKYKPRVEICRGEVARAIKEDNLRDEAYYGYQLALFLTILEKDNPSEALEIWNSLRYDGLNLVNRWYARYIASRAWLREAMQGDREDAIEHALAHCAGMYSCIMHEDARAHGLAEEPATWMISGVVLLEYAGLQNDEEMRKEAIIMMIEAFLRGMTPPKGVRCVINIPMLYADIKSSFDEKSVEYNLLDTDDLKKGYQAARDIQKALMKFDDSLLDLVERSY